VVIRVRAWFESHVSHYPRHETRPVAFQPVHFRNVITQYFVAFCAICLRFILKFSTRETAKWNRSEILISRAHAIIYFLPVTGNLIIIINYISDTLLQTLLDASIFDTVKIRATIINSKFLGKSLWRITSSFMPDTVYTL